MYAKRFGTILGARPTLPRQPTYSDEVTAVQFDAIKAAVDPDGRRSERRVLLNAAGW